MIMALIVKVNSNANNDAAEAYGACKAIQNGFAALDRLDALRGESIAVSAAEMATNFGVEDSTQSQAYSDRWAAALAAWNDSGNSEFQKIRDLVQPLKHKPA
jgi:hypothetical protein